MHKMELKIPAPVLALIIAVIMWWLAKVNSFTLPSSQIKSMLSLLFLIVGFVIDVSAVICFQMARTTVNPFKPHATVSLVNVGIYKYSRNPMYLGLLFVLCAWAIWLGEIVNFVAIPIYVWYVTRFQIKPEERMLTQLFPDAFGIYKSQVRRWL